MYWYKQLPDVPKGFSFYVAHEFFDALPVHKFQVRNCGPIVGLCSWRVTNQAEVLSWILPTAFCRKKMGGGVKCSLILIQVLCLMNRPHHSDTFCLREKLSAPRFFCLTRYVENHPLQAPFELWKDWATLAFEHFQFGPRESREHIEVCPDGAVLIQEIANRVAIDGGFALIADYGHTGNKEDTFRVCCCWLFLEFRPFQIEWRGATGVRWVCKVPAVRCLLLCRLSRITKCTIHWSILVWRTWQQMWTSLIYHEWFKTEVCCSWMDDDNKSDSIGQTT